METLIDKEQKRYIKKFHTLLGRTGGGENAKKAILQSYGVASSRDLSVAELIEVCDALDRELNPELAKLDTNRKQLIAAISSYHRVMGVDIFQKKYEDCTPYEKQQRNQYAKGTAEKASGIADFNDIPLNQLHGLYNGFVKNRKHIEAVDNIANNDLLRRVNLN